MKPFGNNLRIIREERNKSIQQVSNATGISKSSIRGYELNYNEPGAHALCALADYYNVSVDRLMGREYTDYCKNCPGLTYILSHCQNTEMPIATTTTSK